MTTQPTLDNDTAWASINTPLSMLELKEFCQDIERLFRINPMLEFKQWKQLGDQLFHFNGKNISQETPFEFETDLTAQYTDDGLYIQYDQGIKSSTTLKIEPSEYGSKLTITDQYQQLPVEQRKEHLPEVDQSITIWAEYLQRYLINWKRFSKFGPWRWYMRRVWQPMKPMGRRITYILLWVSVVEVALIALGVGIYFAEYSNP